jgi:hypothetical protein
MWVMWFALGIVETLGQFAATESMNSRRVVSKPSISHWLLTLTRVAIRNGIPAMNAAVTRPPSLAATKNKRMKATTSAAA